MAAHTGGYIFIPTAHYLSYVGLLHDVITALGGPQHIEEMDSFDTGTIPIKELSLETALEQLCQSKRGGVIDILIADFGVSIWVNEAANSTYISLRVSAPDAQFMEPEGDPMKVEVFANTFIQLCEAVGAQAATITNSQRDFAGYRQRKLEALKQGDIEDFLSGYDWLTYLEPALAQRGRVFAERINAPKDEEDHKTRVYPKKYWHIETLESGALVLHAGRGYNPELGNQDVDYHARFLLQQLEQHRQIPGVDTLLADLQKELDGHIHRIYDDGDSLKHGRNAYLDHAGLAQSRAYLDKIRALWAVAYDRPGLVSVEQSFMSLHNDGQKVQVVVPAVADQGKEWLYPTLQYPFVLQDEAWTNPHEGLETQVLNLLNVAQHNPIADKLPRVVVYFWRGVSQQVHEALLEMGAEVEVADHLPVLG